MLERISISHVLVKWKPGKFLENQESRLWRNFTHFCPYRVDVGAHIVNVFSTITRILWQKIWEGRWRRQCQRSAGTWHCPTERFSSPSCLTSGNEKTSIFNFHHQQEWWWQGGGVILGRSPFPARASQPEIPSLVVSPPWFWWWYYG